MVTFDWSRASSTLKDFGGKPVILYVPKTGLPFFDVLRLYGAIDLYIGLRDDVAVYDKGNEWEATGFVRENRIKSKIDTAWNKILKPDDDLKEREKQLLSPNRKKKLDETEIKAQLDKKKKELSETSSAHKGELENALKLHSTWPQSPLVENTTPLNNPDSALKDGNRDQAALKYNTFQSGFGIKSKMPWSNAVLSFAGQMRTETYAKIMFLPVFQGKVDFSKVVAPLRFWGGSPNVICAQALILLGLKTSLFSEGYQDRLSAVVYNTDYDSRKNFNYSGIISIQSTALEKGNLSAEAIDQIYRVFKRIIERAWRKDRNPKDPLPEDALAMAYWLMQPVGKHLSSMITSQERLLKVKGYYQQIFIKPEYVKEVFGMSYGDWKGDNEAVRKFARTVASAIYSVRQCKEVDKSKKGKVWYDEVVMLRSAPTAKAFIERALILVEQGHKEYSLIGTAHKDEAYDPSKLFDSIGKDRSEFETFRDLFRMYLIQESTSLLSQR